MVGKGFAVFSLMGYVIANMKPDKTVGFQVELNTAILSAVFGEPEEIIQRAIDFLCTPDPKSRTPAEDGRRLVQVGRYAYRVVNGVMYDKLRNEEDRREQNRLSQQRHRAGKTKKHKRVPPSGREVRFLNAETQEEQDRIAAEGLPEPALVTEPPPPTV